VLVAQRHLRSGVPDPPHEFGKSRTRLCRENGSGMPQVVNTQIGAASGQPGLQPVSSQRVRVHLRIGVFDGREEQRFATERDML